MFVFSKHRIIVIGFMLVFSSFAMASQSYAGQLTISDAYTADWPVTVKCPDGNIKTITNTNPAFCSVLAGNTVTLTNNLKISCKARIAIGGKVDPAKSTCISGSYATGTLALTANQGVYPGVLWTMIDSDSADWNNGGVTVACPNKVARTINSTASVNCAIPANAGVKFSVGGKAACTANFDANSNYLPSTSTCKPTSYAGNTLVFSAAQGIVPPPPPNQVIGIGFPGGGVTVSCSNGNCGTISTQQVILNTPLKQNGAMTLSFSTGSGKNPITCDVAFYNDFINSRHTTCQGIALVPPGDTAAYNLTFPAASNAGELVVYPASTPSQLPGTKVGSRKLTFVNQCSQPVWYSLVSGTVGAKPGTGHGTTQQSGNLCAGSPNTKDNIACPAGTSCRYVNQTQAYCFFDPVNPAIPSDGNLLKQYMLAAPKGKVYASSTLDIPIYKENAVVFSGGASARVGCQDASGKFVHCAIGNCNADSNALGCGYTNGTENGSTIAEFTLQTQAIDFYDLSIINGAHIPMSMAPTNGQQFDSKQQESTVGYYWCGAPGSSVAGSPPTNQPACNWNFALNLPITPNKANYYINVAAPKITAAQQTNGTIDVNKLNYCSANADCTAPQSCGLSLDLLLQLPADTRSALFSAMGANGKAGPFTCGVHLGYDTPVNICSLVTSGDDGYLHCNNSLSQISPASGPAVSLTYANLYSCNGPTDNCIKAAADYTGKVCCGCTTWPTSVSGVMSGMSNACTFSGSTQYGTNTNNAWDGSATPGPDVKSKIKFLKQACPSAYAYQFDDATSTFNCYVDGKKNSKGYNMTDYTITFCPGGTEIQ